MAITKSKRYEIVDARNKKAKRAQGRDLVLDDGRRVKFNRRGTFTTDDPGLAHAIDEKFGYSSKQGNGAAVICELEHYNETRDRKVKRVNYLTVPALPWHKYDPDTGKRI